MCVYGFQKPQLPWAKTPTQCHYKGSKVTKFKPQAMSLSLTLNPKPIHEFQTLGPKLKLLNRFKQQRSPYNSKSTSFNTLHAQPKGFQKHPEA